MPPLKSKSVKAFNTPNVISIFKLKGNTGIAY